ncbi:MAG: EamA family transporter [Candidatus Woesearchaeota archaeon]
MKGINLVLVSVIATTIGQVLLKSGSSSAGALSFSSANLIQSLISIFSQPAVILGIIVYGLGAIIWILALSATELSKAYPILSLSFVIVAVASYLLFSESMPIHRIAGIITIIIGVVFMSRS